MISVNSSIMCCSSRSPFSHDLVLGLENQTSILFALSGPSTRLLVQCLKSLASLPAMQPTCCHASLPRTASRADCSLSSAVVKLETSCLEMVAWTSSADASASSMISRQVKSASSPPHSKHGCPAKVNNANGVDVSDARTQHIKCYEQYRPTNSSFRQTRLQGIELNVWLQASMT